MLCHTACIVLALLAADTTPPAPAVADVPAAAVVPVGITVPPELAAPARQAPLPPLLAPAPPPAADTTSRPRAVEHSDAYFTRLTIHRYASYVMLPLFAAQYLAGEQLMEKGDQAPAWARESHGALAAGVAGLFAVNTVTGGLNLWEARHEPEGRTRRTLHAGLMLLADAGFAATGMLAEDAEESGGRRDLHRSVAIGSMAVSLLSYAVMLPVFGNR